MPLLKNTIASCESNSVRIWMAGDLDTIRKVCREFCWDEGMCVTVTATEFFYTGGSETGAVIGLINYPRFPKELDEIMGTARKLADYLRTKCCQWSYTIEAPLFTEWHSNRDES